MSDDALETSSASREAAGPAPASEPPGSGDAAASPGAGQPTPAAVVKQVLLIHPDAQLRGTIVQGCRTTPGLQAHAVSSVQLGEECLKELHIDGLMLSVENQVPALAFLSRLREGKCRAAADIPVVLLAHSCDTELAGKLKAFGVRRLLLQPFKLREVMQTLEQLWTELGSAPAADTAAEPLSADPLSAEPLPAEPAAAEPVGAEAAA